MKNNKKIIITVLSILLIVMAIGYALLAQELTINGSASIDSTWRVEITNITQKEINGGVTEKGKSYTATTANFDIGFTQPGDYVVYDIEVTNSGTLDAVISNINVITDNNPAIIYTTSGLKKADTIAKNGEKKYLTVKIEYDSNITSQPALDNNDITIQMDYQQDLGQVVVYDEYSVGDTIELAGSNWRVIKDSSSEEDYVTLMKETVLTNAELGSYTPGQGYNTVRFIYDWSNTDYDNSKIKDALTYYMSNFLNQEKLKDIDNYKIRLISKEELINNLFFEITDNDGDYHSTDNTPTWAYKNFGENNGKVYNGYYTMTSYNFSYEWAVDNYGWLRHDGHKDNDYYGVRPVINLLKSSIE